MATSAVTNRVKDGQIKRDGKERTHEHKLKLGVNKYLAWSMAYYGAHIARVCHGGAMHNAITKERLTQFGLVSMLDYYTERCVTC
jgi:hypothetical protein